MTRGKILFLCGQEGSAKSAQSLADELAAKKEQTQKELAETEKALADLKNQTVDAQKAAEEKLKALSLDQGALDKVCRPIHEPLLKAPALLPKARSAPIGLALLALWPKRATKRLAQQFAWGPTLALYYAIHDS